MIPAKFEIEKTETITNQYGTVTITKLKTNSVMGEYKPTAKDIEKKQAQMRLIYCNSGSFTVVSKVGLTGRGVKSYGNGSYEVTEKALEKLKSQYTWATDF